MLFSASDDDSELNRFGEHLPDVPLVNTNIFFKFVNVVVNQHNIFLFLISGVSAMTSSLPV